MDHMIRAVIERQLLECASVAEYDIGMEQPFRHKIESGDVQIIAQPLQVSLVLPNRIVKQILLRSSSAIWKHLCPISIMAVAEDPSAKVLGFEDIDAGFMQEKQIDLCHVSIRLRDITITKAFSISRHLLKLFP